MMVNSLDMATVSHFGVDNKSPLEARRKAGFLFARALSRGRRRSFWRRLTGKEYRLRALAEAGAGRRLPAEQVSVVTVALDKIVGSENRVEDFDSAFNPLTSHSRDRWIGIAVARRRGAILPPVELIQVGNEYFIRDGHHRVSVARAAGQAEIEARIVQAMVS